MRMAEPTGSVASTRSLWYLVLRAARRLDHRGVGPFRIPGGPCPLSVAGTRRECVVSRGSAILGDVERMQLADVVAFLRDVLDRVERFAELDEVAALPEGETARPHLWYGPMTPARALRLLDQYREDRVALERALVIWGGHAPYYLLQAERDGRLRPPKHEAGMYALASENGISVPSVDALIDAAVVWCVRHFDVRDHGHDASEPSRTLSALGAVVHVLVHFGHASGAGAASRLRRSAPKCNGQLMITLRTYGRDEWLEYVTTFDEPGSEWRNWLAALERELPKAPRRGQRYGAKKATETVATLIGVAPKTIASAIRRAAGRGAECSHLEHERSAARLRAVRARIREEIAAGKAARLHSDDEPSKGG